MNPLEKAYWIGVVIGMLPGWLLHNAFLQLAYRWGIVEYKGYKK